VRRRTARYPATVPVHDHVKLTTALLALLLSAPPAVAQTEYADLDRGLPLRVQDAYAIARDAWELQLAPAVASSRAGTAAWGLATAVAWGALPRTQLEIAAPLASVPAASGSRAVGLDGLEFGALYGLNAETLGLPAFAVAARVAAPAGALGPTSSLLTVEGIATRSWPGVRLHLNVSATAGPSDTSTGALERSRWFAGAAVDHTWPLSSLLVAAELVALQPLDAGSPVAWSAGAGARWQWTPRLVLDAGLSRRFTGDSAGWSATLGVTWTFAIRALMAVPR
jgi:hypothetical protein